MVELGIATVSACHPTLRPLFRRSIDGLQRLRSYLLGTGSGRKFSDPQWPGHAFKEGWTPLSPDSNALGGERGKKLQKLSEKVWYVGSGE